MSLLRVGVVLGGRSSEREISLESGRNLLANLDPSRYQGLPFYMDGQGRLWEIGLPHLVQNTCADLEDRLAQGAAQVAYEDLPAKVDFVYIGLHGKYGEDGCFQGLLELLDLPYSGSGVLGAALGMDKRMQRFLLAQAGVAVPRSHAIAQEAWAADADGQLAAATAAVGWPAVVKPSREGCSTALAVVEDEAGLRAAVAEALGWDRHALVEERLQGTEVTVVVLEDEAGRPKAYPPTETPPKGAFLTIEEKFLPGQGMNITPARLPAETLAAVADVAERAFTALGLRVFARMDMYVTEDGRIVLGEPNTLPGSSPSSTIFLGPMEEGIGPMALVSLVIERSLAAHQGKKGPLD